MPGGRLYFLEFSRYIQYKTKRHHLDIKECIMPTYEYECKSCGYTFDAFQSMTDTPMKECPRCGLEVRRLINGGSGVIFKGSGFYVTDRKGSGDSKKTGEPKTAGEPKKQEAPACASGCARADSCPAAASTEKKAAGA
jgi:putative FmdB family regulatory protein